MGIQQRFTAGRFTAAVAAAVMAVSLTACSDDDPALTVGHDASVESRTAAAVYAGALARTGIAVQTNSDSASQGELLDQVASGELGLFPSFTGDLLVQLTPAPKALTAQDVLADVNRSLPQQVSIGDPSLVSDRWQVLAQQKAIEDAGAEKLADCGRLPAGLPLLVTRDPGKSVLDAVAACHHGPVQTVATTDELVSRVRSGDALALTTALDSASVEDLTGVQTLQSEGAPIAQQLVPVFASGQMEKPQLKALSRVAGELTTADLAQMVREVRGGADPRTVARQWLSTNGV
ncbi:glycine betaine ABC transporter substrate-binding protein [Gordonia sp. (in: high G+C Gram-positive bacteria)]|uniref:glycine betaine ABC transporter substrate-binding protein n=1 Tax=Gordonia sp. (in: high G+C Gram-positive bacteria) TaxID=84139 RepID=UPI003F94B7C2